MDSVIIQIVNTALPKIREAMTLEVLKSFDENHKIKTGRLRKSIGTKVNANLSQAGVTITVYVFAGGSDLGAYYGWFLEYGTGRYTDLPGRALKGYPGFEFNQLRPAAGKGWDIVGRPESEHPGRFISKGIRPSHWFRKGVQRGFQKFNLLIGETMQAVNAHRGNLEIINKMANRINAQ